MAILIRELTEEQENGLKAAKKAFYEKTNSQAVLRLLEKFEKDQEELRKLRIEKENIARELNQYKETFKQIKWQMETGLPTVEDESQFY